ncbi:MAG: hypothetical protein V4793_04900 [Paraburkholderia tropica]|uniref:alginate O-acetyltransferase AlgX-related protein n=1 Tax=Paraburkholderia tropica TaxID=92647 RepID=UPI00159041FE|nr:hypothetical protein [Paraburkholderia tropica]MBB3000782.1 hypothetical protein [Paraburkholderia tropica]MBB6319430.1 hypothetical protein [Paraburkholderia tropica]
MANIIMVVAFSAAITMPFVTMWSGDGSNSEQRNLTSFPSLDLSEERINDFPKDFDAYVNDRFGFRNVFLNLHSYLLYKIFHVSGAAKVLAGQGNWLFIFDDGSRPDILRQGQLSTEKLEDWKQTLNRRYTWLKSQGIDYRFMVGTEKSTVYPEYLPKGVLGKGPSRLQGIESYLGNPSYFVNPAAALKARKGEERGLYFHTDTHWTQYGAYLGYRELMKSIGLSDFAYQNPTFTNVTLVGGGDMSRMIRVPTNEVVPEVKGVLTSDCAKPRQAQWPLGMEIDHAIIFATVCPGKTGTALVFRDSFFTSIVPFFSQNYGRVVYVWTSPDSALFVKMVQQEKPTIVVEELVERAMGYAPSPDLAQYADKTPVERTFTTQEVAVQRRRNEFLGADVRLKTIDGSARFIDGDRTLAMTSGVDVSLGNIDSVRRTGQGVDLSGWAAIGEQNVIPDFIVVTQGDRVVYVNTPQWTNRLDVARHFNSDALAMSGFAMHIPPEFVDSAQDLKFYSISGKTAALITYQH